MNSLLAREESPIKPETWKVLDETMVQAAKSVLTGRRLLNVEGPYGLGLKAIPLQDAPAKDGFIVSPVLPLMYIQKNFTLAKRDLAAFEQQGVALDTGNVALSAIEVARMEDTVVFNGAAGNAGLMSTKGIGSLKIGPWNNVGTAADDIIKAVNVLDAAGFHGPYSLALAPGRYNALLRLYPPATMTELEHLRTIISDGVVKAPILPDGGVLIATGPQFASIVLGQDMSVGFIGPVDEKLQFYISESVALRARVPQAICVIRE